MKKMKYINIAKVLLLSCSLAILPACDDFLDEEPQSEVSPEKYLLNESQLEAYVNKYYADYDNWKSDSDDKGGMIPSFWGSENGSTYKMIMLQTINKAPMDDILRIPGLLPRAVASGILPISML